MRIAVQISSKAEWRAVMQILKHTDFSTTPFGEFSGVEGP